MIFTVPLLVLFQALTSVATVAGRDAVFSSEYSEMALALRDPSRVLAIPKRSAAQVLAPDFVSSDSTYWLVEYTYSKASCVSKVVLEVGIATGYCIRTGTASSAKYECTSASSCTVLIYSSDATCASATPTVVDFNLGTCTTMDADDDGYLTDDSNVFTKQQVLAVQGFPSGFSDSTSGLMCEYNSQTCAQNTMFSYRVGYENHCYSNYDGTDYTSTKYTNPSLASYEWADCLDTNLISTRPVPSGDCLVTSATTSEKTTYYGNDNKNSLSAGAIAGIVIGTVAAVAIVAALLHFFVFNKAKAPMSQQAATNNV